MVYIPVQTTSATRWQGRYRSVIYNENIIVKMYRSVQTTSAKRGGRVYMEVLI